MNQSSSKLKTVKHSGFLYDKNLIIEDIHFSITLTKQTNPDFLGAYSLGIKHNLEGDGVDELHYQAFINYWYEGDYSCYKEPTTTTTTEEATGVTTTTTEEVTGVTTTTTEEVTGVTTTTTEEVTGVTTTTTEEATGVTTTTTEEVTGVTTTTTSEGVILHPGPESLIAGDSNLGYFGEWNLSNDLNVITRQDILSVCNPGGVNLSDDGWLKFSYQNKILYIAKKPIRKNVSWNGLNGSAAIFGNTEISKSGYTFKLRLIKGANNNPDDVGGGEWNDLMYRIHQSDGSLWDNFNNSDLGIGSGDGKSTWCQETHSTANYPTRRILRGRFGVESFHGDLASFSSDDMGWRPCLELVQ
jgi:hypothetical protein